MKPSEKETSIFVPGNEEIHHSDTATFNAAGAKAKPRIRKNNHPLRKRAIKRPALKIPGAPAAVQTRKVQTASTVNGDGIGIAQALPNGGYYQYRKEKDTGKITQRSLVNTYLYTVYETTPLVFGGATYYKIIGWINSQHNNRFEEFSPSWLYLIKAGTFAEANHSLLQAYNENFEADAGQPAEKKYSLNDKKLFGPANAKTNVVDYFKRIRYTKLDGTPFALGDVVEASPTLNGKHLHFYVLRSDKRKMKVPVNAGALDLVPEVKPEVKVAADAQPATTTTDTKMVQSSGSYGYLKIGLPVATGLTGFGIAYSIKNQIGISITIGIFSALAGLGVAYAVQPRSSAAVSEGSTANPLTTTSTGTSIQQMKDALVAENVKDGLNKEATEAYVNKLTTKEIQTLFLTLKMPNKDVFSKRFPELSKIPVKTEADGYKLMGAIAEKIQGDYGISGLTAQEFVTNSESAVKKMFA